MKEPLIVILGPTAVGKTDVAIELAKKIQGEIISADSMLIYKYMDIGTAKPKFEERQGIPHYLIDIITPDQPFSVADFLLEAEKKIKEIRKKDKMPMIVGGTALYLKAITEEFYFPETESDWELREKLNQEAENFGNQYVHERLAKIDPITASRLHPNDLRRVIRAIEIYELTGVALSAQPKKEKRSNYQIIKIGLIRPREEIYARINQRVEEMIKQGLVEEVRQLLEMGYDEYLISMQGLGYKQIVPYLKGVYSLDRAVELLKRDTRHFAKRQLTWFRRDEDIHWIEINRYSSQLQVVAEIMKVIKANIN